MDTSVKVDKKDLRDTCKSLLEDFMRHTCHSSLEGKYDTHLTLQIDDITHMLQFTFKTKYFTHFTVHISEL